MTAAFNLFLQFAIDKVQRILNTDVLTVPITKRCCRGLSRIFHELLQCFQASERFRYRHAAIVYSCYTRNISLIVNQSATSFLLIVLYYLHFLVC